LIANGCVQAWTFGDNGGPPHLGALADNGGPTMTMALLPDSPAINRGGTHHPDRDQRGANRPTVADSGAFELLP
jgi:hypothetical protein